MMICILIGILVEIYNSVDCKRKNRILKYSEKWIYQKLDKVEN